VFSSNPRPYEFSFFPRLPSLRHWWFTSDLAAPSCRSFHSFRWIEFPYSHVKYCRLCSPFWLPSSPPSPRRKIKKHFLPDFLAAFSTLLGCLRGFSLTVFQFSHFTVIAQRTFRAGFPRHLHSVTFHGRRSRRCLPFTGS